MRPYYRYLLTPSVERFRIIRLGDQEQGATLLLSAHSDAERMQKSRADSKPQEGDVVEKNLSGEEYLKVRVIGSRLRDRDLQRDSLM